jgi:hypothetical protein
MQKPVVGAPISRDITQGEQVEGDIQRFIERQHAKRVAEEGQDRAKAEAWKESVHKYNVVRTAEIRDAWCEYHKEQAARHRAVLADLVRHHEGEAEKLGGGAA